MCVQCTHPRIDQYNDDDILKQSYLSIVLHLPIFLLLTYIRTIFVMGQGMLNF